MQGIQTVTIDILNNQVVKLLQDLEGMHLIRLRKKISPPSNADNQIIKYKGAMTKQALNDIDMQLKELRNEWE